MWGQGVTPVKRPVLPSQTDLGLFESLDHFLAIRNPAKLTQQETGEKHDSRPFLFGGSV